MPETLMPLLTGLFLVLAGILIGYFLWFRDRTQDEATRLRLHNENEDLNAQLQKFKTEHKTLASELSGQQSKLHILQELCDELVDGREQFQQDRIALESDMNSHRSQMEMTQSQLDEERRCRLTAEDRLHQEQQQFVERLNAEENSWREQVSKLQTNLLHRTTDIKQLAGVNDRTTEKLHAAEATVAELRSELASQRSLVEVARQNESGLEKEYVSLESSLQNYTELLKESRGQCAAALSAKQLAEDAVRDTRRQLDDQKMLLAKMDETMTASESVKLRCLSLEQSLENSKDRLGEITLQRDQAMAGEKEIRESVAALQTRIQNQELTIRQLRAKTDEFSIKIRDEKQSRLEFEAAVNEIQSNLQRERDEMSAQFESLQQTNLQSTSLLEQQLTQIATLKRGREKLATQLATLEQQQHINEARLEERSGELHSIQIERENLASKLAKLREEHVRGEADVEKRMEEIQKLCDERDELSDRLSDRERDMAESRLSTLHQREDIQTRLGQLVSQRDQGFTEVESLKSETEALRAEIDELKQTRTEPVILTAPFGEQYDDEYGGPTRRHDTRGVIYLEAPNYRDDLKLISGIAGVLEKRLNEYGVYTFKQIMEWEEKTVREFSTLLTFKDRIDRDNWLEQARELYSHKQRERKAA